MTTRRGTAAVIVCLSVLVAGLTGCSKTAGTPVAAPEATATKATATATAGSTTASETTSAATSEVTTATMPAAPTGPPVGTAVMKVIGGNAPVTIRYQINGGQEQTETGVTLPWEKEYPVYDKLETSVTADGGEVELICTITMDGDKLVSFKTEKRPTCNFAYWG